jgi:Putative Ig domain.
MNVNRKTKPKRLLSMLLVLMMVLTLLPTTAFAEQHAVFKTTPSNLTAKVGDPLFASMTLDMSLVQDKGGTSVIELEKNNGTGWSRFLFKSYGEATGGELNESLGIRTVGQVDRFRWRVHTTDAVWQYSDEFTATWNAPTVTTISSVAITGVTEPTVGGTAQTSGMTVTTPGVKIEAANTNWVKEVPEGWLTMNNGGYFSAGETYGIKVQLAPTDTDSYQFADTVTVTLNGHTVGTVEKFGYMDQNRLITYSFGKLSSAPSIETGGLPDGEVGVAYNEALTASGSDPITWSIESGSLPPGLILGGNAIGGTPTTTGTYNFTVKAENSAGFDTLALSIVINAAVTVPSITTTTLPSGTCNAPYSQTLSATGTAPITWSIESGALPDGLSISGDTITGTPTTAGTFNFTVKAANSGGNDTKSLSITIDPITISSVTITGVHEPAVGETPTFADITTSTPGVTIKTSYSYAYWFYDEDGTWYTMSGLFLAGKTHAIQFVIEPSQHCLCLCGRSCGNGQWK